MEERETNRKNPSCQSPTSRSKKGQIYFLRYQQIKKRVLINLIATEVGIFYVVCWLIRVLLSIFFFFLLKARLSRCKSSTLTQGLLFLWLTQATEVLLRKCEYSINALYSFQISAKYIYTFHVEVCILAVHICTFYIHSTVILRAQKGFFVFVCVSFHFALGNLIQTSNLVLIQDLLHRWQLENAEGLPKALEGDGTWVSVSVSDSFVLGLERAKCRRVRCEQFRFRGTCTAL